MKQKSYSSDEFVIVCRLKTNNIWTTDIKEIPTPCTMVYGVSSASSIDIQKVVWDTGDITQKISQDKKSGLSITPIECRHRKSHKSTLSIAASVYTDSKVYTPTVTLITSNPDLKEHYVDAVEFKKQIVEYYKTSKISDSVAESISKIANRLAFAPNFINYTYREEMVGDATVRMMEALTAQKFDPERGNPFSYFTRIAFNAFCYRIKKEKKMREALTNYQEAVYSDMMGTTGERSTNHNQEFDDYSYEDT